MRRQGPCALREARRQQPLRHGRRGDLRRLGSGHAPLQVLAQQPALPEPGINAPRRARAARAAASGVRALGVDKCRGSTPAVRHLLQRSSRAPAGSAPAHGRRRRKLPREEDAGGRGRDRAMERSRRVLAAAGDCDADTSVEAGACVARTACAPLTRTSAGPSARLRLGANAGREALVGGGIPPCLGGRSQAFRFEGPNLDAFNGNSPPELSVLASVHGPRRSHATTTESRQSLVSPPEHTY